MRERTAWQPRTPCRTNPFVQHRVGPPACRREEDIALDYARRVLADNRDELRRADGKAAQGLAAAGAAAIAVFTTVASGAWQPSGLAEPQRWSWWLACALGTASVGSLLLALMPRLGTPEPGTQLAYFGHIRRLRGRGEVRTAIRLAARQPLPAVLSELCWTSRTVTIKYRLVQVGYSGFALAAILLAGSLW